MPALYETDEKMLKDFNKLSYEYQRKVERYMKDLLRIQRKEQKIEAEIRRIEFQRKQEDKEGASFRCSFCGNHTDEVEFMISGPDEVYICDQCADACNQLLKEEKVKKARNRAD